MRSGRVIKIIASIILRTERTTSHREYDWRNTEKMLASMFKREKRVFVPFNLLRTLNPTVLIRCKKEG